MIYSYEIRESDISVVGKFIAVIWERETIDGPCSVFDFAESDDRKELEAWAKPIVEWWSNK